MTRLLALGIVACLQTAGAGVAAAPVPTPIGVGPGYHPGAWNASVTNRLPIGSLVCSSSGPPRSAAHLELFARGRVVIVPAGIGVAPPVRTRGPYVLSGRCTYPARTREPTGVIELAGSTRITLGEFFAVWGRPLSAQRLLGFRADLGSRVRTYVNGRRRSGDPRAIILRRHDEIVVELGRVIPPHASYRFPKGL